jgi:hypothetical protein
MINRGIVIQIEVLQYVIAGIIVALMVFFYSSNSRRTAGFFVTKAKRSRLGQQPWLASIDREL